MAQWKCLHHAIGFGGFAIASGKRKQYQSDQSEK
jgi:hypothetical protein